MFNNKSYDENAETYFFNIEYWDVIQIKESTAPEHIQDLGKNVFQYLDIKPKYFMFGNEKYLDIVIFGIQIEDAISVYVVPGASPYRFFCSDPMNALQQSLNKYKNDFEKIMEMYSNILYNDKK